MTGTGHLVEARYMEQVPRYAGTWSRYLLFPGYVPWGQSRDAWMSWDRPWAWDQKNLGRHMGLSRPPFCSVPCPALPCPA